MTSKSFLIKDLLALPEGQPQRSPIKPPPLPPVSRDRRRIRRVRTVFSEAQLIGLERRFDRQKYLSTPDRAGLAAALGLSQLQVKTWYQNRRMKWKKQVLEGGAVHAPTKPKGRPRKDEIPSLESLEAAGLLRRYPDDEESVPEHHHHAHQSAVSQSDDQLDDEEDQDLIVDDSVSMCSEDNHQCGESNMAAAQFSSEDEQQQQNEEVQRRALWLLASVTVLNPAVVAPCWNFNATRPPNLYPHIKFH